MSGSVLRLDGRRDVGVYWGDISPLVGATLAWWKAKEELDTPSRGIC